MANILDKDSDNLIKLLEKKKILKEDDVECIKSIHEISYSLALWSYIHKDSTNTSKYYLDEIRSDCVQAIPLLLMGYKKPTSLLIRGIIENSLKHIYFYHHPIELQRLLTEDKYYISMENYYDYLHHHPTFAEEIDKYDFLHKLRETYREYSLLVHGKKLNSLQLYKSITQINFDRTFLLKYHTDFKKIGEIINFMFVLFYKHDLDNYRRDYKDIILNNMSPRQKKLFHKIK